MHKLNKGLKLFQYLLPAIIWGAGIFIIISLPGSAIPKSKLLKIEHFDKVIHFVMFFGFSFLLSFGFYKQQVYTLLQKRYIIYALLAGVIYGILTEGLQAVFFASRSGNVWDILANAAGTIAGILVFSGLFKELATPRTGMTN